MDVFNLQQEVLVLRNRVERFVALLRLLIVLARASGFSLACARFPDAAVKVSLLRAIERSCSVLSATSSFARASVVAVKIPFVEARG